MKSLTYKDSIEYFSTDEYFNQEEKKLLLQIPHKVEEFEKYNKISFKVPENGKYPLLARVNMVEIKTPLTEEERKENKEYRLAMLNVSTDDRVKGLFINANHGSAISYFLYELYNYDKENAKKMMKEYHEVATSFDDVISIEDRFIKQLALLTEYLNKEDLTALDFKIDYLSYANYNEKQMSKLIKDLNTKYGKAKKFGSYNDLDLTPMIVEGDYCFHDSASATFYLVKENNGVKDIYFTRMDKINTIFDHHELEDVSDWFSEFSFDYKQIFVEMRKNLTERDLIGQITNGVLTKASSQLMTMDLLQNAMMEELVEKEKITIHIEDLSFKELLLNYTKQNEMWLIEERSIIPLLEAIKIIDNKVTYNEFSLVKVEKVIKHEIINENSYKNLNDFNKAVLKNLKNIPEKFQEEIVEYLDDLLMRDNTEHSKIFVSLIKKNLTTSKSKKLKV